ncbi:MAG: RsmE family RNA methyltransferase [bacterium]
MTRRIPVSVGSIACGVVPLDADADHYVRRVLRLAVGTPVEVFDGAGTVGIGHLDDASVTVSEVVAHRPPTPFITLYQAIPKGDRWDWVVEKSTELGVDCIVPIQTQWSVVDTPPHKVAAKVERWQKIATGAARQSERVFTPTVMPPVGLREALKSAKGLNLPLTRVVSR